MDEFRDKIARLLSLTYEGSNFVDPHADHIADVIVDMMRNTCECNERNGCIIYCTECGEEHE